MADETYDPFNLRKHPGYYAELVQESDPQADIAASYVKNHGQPGGILEAVQANPRGWGDSPLPFDPTGAELRSTSEGGSAFKARPQDLMHPVAEAISPTLGAFGAGQMAGSAYKEFGEGDYTEAGMSLAPLLAGAVMPGVPKGVKPKIPREIDARGFYSPSLEAVKGLGQEKGTVAQFRSMLLSAGGKPKELEAIGFDKAFPDPNAKVSRAEIEGYLRDNRVQLGSNYPDDLPALERKLAEMRPRIAEIERDLGPRGARDSTEYQVLVEEYKHLAGQLPGERYESYSTPGGIPGSYREVVTTLPSKPQMDALRVRQDAIRAEQNAMERSGRHRSPEYAALSAEYQANQQKLGASSEFGSGEYTSSHWPGITNPLLHYRVKDFDNQAGMSQWDRIAVREYGKPLNQLSDRQHEHVLDISGAGDYVPGITGPQSKTRVLDEMQSDWAQRARDQGFKDPARVEDLKRQIVEQTSKRDEIAALMARTAEEIAPGSTQSAEPLVVLRQMAVSNSDSPQGQRATAILADLRQIENNRLDLMSKLSAAERGTPSAPYISNTSDWVDLGLKQALIDAARDPSVSRLAWAPGKVQADRYSLTNHISGIRYSPEMRSVQVTHPYDDAKRWYSLEGATGDVGPERLPDLVGKELAEQLLAAPKQKMGGGSPYEAHTLSDLGSIEVGGRGMKSFYGDLGPDGTLVSPGIVGTRLQKLVKGLDPEAARVEPHKIADKDVYSGDRKTKWEGTKPVEYPSIPITPTMREKILKEGLPLFNIAALSALISRMLGQGPNTDDTTPGENEL